MSHASASLTLGGLNHLLRFLITGCAHSGRVAARLLEELAESPELDSDTRTLCEDAGRALERRTSSQP